jgi:hypothetical protein
MRGRQDERRTKVSLLVRRGRQYAPMLYIHLYAVLSQDFAPMSMSAYLLNKNESRVTSCRDEGTVQYASAIIINETK